MLNLFSVAGYKNSGKSTLCRALLDILRERGLRAGYIKRTHDDVASPPGTDSGGVLGMGMDALVWGGDSIRFESPLGESADMTPHAVACRFFPDTDLVIMEGGKGFSVPKIWVLGESGEVPDYPGIFAVYDRFGPGDGKFRFGCGDTGLLADRIESLCRGNNCGARAYTGDEEIKMKEFVSDFIEGGIRGMLGSLKGVPDKGQSGSYRIYIADRKGGKDA